MLRRKKFKKSDSVEVEDRRALSCSKTLSKIIRSFSDIFTSIKFGCPTACGLIIPEGDGIGNLRYLLNPFNQRSSLLR
jgi:hypothetical protein